MQSGLIIKGIGGFYYVKTGGNVVECRARGRLRKDKTTPMIGDWVELEMENETMAITSIMPRKNFITRPAVANIDQVIVVVAAKSPEPSLTQIDKVLCGIHYQNLEAVICISKADLSPQGQTIADIYKKAGYPIVCTSAHTMEGIDELKKQLKDKISALSGCSGVGKSSLINAIDNRFSLATNEVGKTERGRHTTTHTQLLELVGGGYIADTPGFGTVDIEDIPKEKLTHCFPEFEEYLDRCRFSGCSHTAEPDCAVKEAVQSGLIGEERYESYAQFYKQLSMVREW